MDATIFVFSLKVLKNQLFIAVSKIATNLAQFLNSKVQKLAIWFKILSKHSSNGTSASVSLQLLVSLIKLNDFGILFSLS